MNSNVSTTRIENGPAVSGYVGSLSIICSLLLACVVLHVLIPKAGVKVGNVPLTAADVSFAALLAMSVLVGKRWRSSGLSRKTSRFLLFGIAYFGVRTVLMGLDPENLARLTVLSIYPLVFFIIVMNIRSNRQMDIFVRTVGVCVLGVMLYGLAQHTFGERNVLIRGITANWSDSSDPAFLEDKDNLFAETGQLKLTSTYQNGNILGVNLLLLLPIASLGLSKAARYLLFPASLAVIGLTGSRSAWMGMLFLLLLWLLLDQESAKKRILWAIMIGTCAILFVFYTSLGQIRILEKSDDWLLSWSGRLAGAAIIVQDTLHSSPRAILFGIHAPDESDAYEMVYFSIYETFGAVGLIVWALPLALSLYVFYEHRGNKVARAAFLGIAAWMFVAVSEGAFWLPPTSFNLWTVLALGWCAILLSGRFEGTNRMSARLRPRYLKPALTRAGFDALNTA